MLTKLGNNATEIKTHDDSRILFSYETPVAVWTKADGYFVTSLYHSKTTAGHVKAWIPEGKEARRVSQECIDAFVKGARR